MNLSALNQKHPITCKYQITRFRGYPLVKFFNLLNTSFMTQLIKHRPPPTTSILIRRPQSRTFFLTLLKWDYDRPCFTNSVISTTTPTLRLTVHLHSQSPPLSSPSASCLASRGTRGWAELATSPSALWTRRGTDRGAEREVSALELQQYWSSCIDTVYAVNLAVSAFELH